MQRALVAAVLVGSICGVLGFFVVLRRLAFLGVGISHSAIGGVAIGLWLGLSPLLTASVFAVAVALAIGVVSRRTHLGDDAVIGVFFSGSMAFALVLLSLQSRAQQDLFGYLFGNILAISWPELAALGLVGGGVLLMLAVTFRRHLLVAFDEEIAEAYGHPVSRLNDVLLVALALTVVLGVRLVGVLLVEALLVIPAAAAALWAANYRSQVILSALIGSGCGVVGLSMAYVGDVPAGGAIVLVTIGVFLVALVGRRISAN